MESDGIAYRHLWRILVMLMVAGAGLWYDLSREDRKKGRD